jgi:hypothetical protein
VYPDARRGQERPVTTGTEEKRAENEATFRDANEQIRGRAGARPAAGTRALPLRRFDVVEKREGSSAELAEETDPRS